MSANGEQIYKSACRMCHGGCGVLVYVKDDVITKIKGDPESPLNKGRMCIKGAASLQHVYHSDRLKNPLKRAGERGEGKWERITWDEAYDILATKLQQIIDENGPESIALGTGTGRHHCLWVGRFANALGTPNCLQTVRAVSLLPVITGNLDVPGGWVFGNHGLGGFPFLHENLSENMKQKRLGSDQFRVLARTNSAHVPALFEVMRTGVPYPIRAFLIFGNNPLLTYADSKKIYDSLMKLDFFCVMDLYMTPSAELADLVLPAASWLELDAATGFPSFAENVVLTQRKIVQIGECKQDEVVFSELARRMNLPVGQETPEEIYDALLTHYFGITFKQLQERGFVEKPQSYYKYEADGFNTPTGKVELYSTELERLGYDPLPYYAEPPESPISDPETARDYPFILITGSRTQNYFTSEYRQIPKLRDGHPDPLVEIHPESAKSLGIADGEWVWIETKRGEIKQKAKTTDGIDPRVVHVEFGWWFPEKKDGEYGVWESNANVLTNQGPPYDPAMGTYQLRALLCQVYKVE